MRNMSEEHPDPGRGKTVALYTAFGASLLLMVVPHAVAAAASLVLLLGVLIAAYIVRGKNDEDSLAGNHAVFIIGTIWISGFFALLTMIAASFYMLPRVDNAALQPCMQNLLNNYEALMQNQDIAALSAMLQPCMHDFVQGNYRLFLVSLLIAAAPVLLYIAVRFTRGLARAIGGYRVAKPRSWL